MSQQRHRQRLLLLAVVSICCLELASWLGGAVLAQRGLFYTPPPRIEGYLARRDPVLGWVMRSREVDASGSRVVPAAADPTATPCVAIYGDSFAWAEEVDAEHAWGNVATAQLGCRVANYGVVGYGPDQALMRFQRSRPDGAKIVILTHLSENIMRNVNRLRNLLAPADAPSLKPRFTVTSTGELRLVPMYSPTSDAELRAMLERPEDLLEDEAFAPGGPTGMTRLTFPFTLSLARAATSFKVRAAVMRRASHADFYRHDNPAQGLQVSLAITRAFAAEARARQALPLVVLLPLVSDFDEHRRTGSWAYAPLMSEMDRASVPYLETGSMFLAELAGADPCSLYVRCAGGHLNDKGNELLGRIVADWVKARESDLGR